MNALEVFEGAMLSDASLVIGLHGVNAYFKLDQGGVNHLDWLQRVKGALTELGVKVSPMYPKLYDRELRCGVPYLRLVLVTHVSLFLTEQYRRWYPSGRKVVPADIQLTPVSLADWFAGDGTSVWLYGRWGTYVKFCTEGFSEEGVLLLRDELWRLGFHATTPKCGKGRRIGINRQGEISAFMNIVEPYVVPSYSYKLKRRLLLSERRNEAHDHA